MGRIVRKVARPKGGSKPPAGKVHATKAGRPKLKRKKNGATYNARGATNVAGTLPAVLYGPLTGG